MLNEAKHIFREEAEPMVSEMCRVLSSCARAGERVVRWCGPERGRSGRFHSEDVEEEGGGTGGPPRILPSINLTLVVSASSGGSELGSGEKREAIVLTVDGDTAFISAK